MGRPRFVSGECTEVPWAGLTGTLCHEYDERGNHRITHNGRLGDWARFAEPALYKLKDRTFIAFTDYYSHMNEIIEIIAVLPRTLADCYNGGDNG